MGMDACEAPRASGGTLGFGSGQAGSGQAGSRQLVGEVVKLDRGFPLIRIVNGTDAGSSNGKGGSDPLTLRCELSAEVKKHSDIKPVIGDEVQLSLPEGHDMGVITAIQPRRNELVRRDPVDRAVSQTMASNFDQIMVVQPANNINLKRLERELVLAYETGADVSIVLTKTDLAMDDLDDAVESVRSICPSTMRIYPVSSADASTLDDLMEHLAPNTTTVLIGKSGVGKSTLINNLVGEEVARTGSVRESDEKGRHTTVSREIISLPNGSRIVDMPGVRGLGLWDARDGMERAFFDIIELEDNCKFRDCTHREEPGCAVRQAVESGRISEERLKSYRGLMDELSKVEDTRRRANWR